MVSDLRRDLVILSIVGAIFFVVSVYFSFLSPTYSSPDETANAFFANVFAENGRLFIFEPLNFDLAESLHPRSVISLEGRLLPTSFLGLPILFGVLSRVFGLWSLPIWTPFFAVLAVLAWFAIISRIFDRRTGFLSALILFCHPAWFFWTARPLMHNVLFVSFLVFVGFFLVVRPIELFKKRIGWLDPVLAGLCLGLSLWIRTFEIFWIGAMVIAGIIILRKHFSEKKLFLFLFSAFLATLPLLAMNNSLYGGPFQTGYTAVGKTAVVEIDSGLNSTMLSASPSAIEAVEIKKITTAQFFLNAVAPFGLHLQTTIHHVWNYNFYMFWWLTIPALFGFWFMFPRKSDKNDRRAIKFFLIFLSLGSFIWLSSVYGSWTIHDNPDTSAITMGNSYLRYWLPLFLLATLPIALIFQKLITIFFARKWRVLMGVALFLLIGGLGFWVAFFSSDDALWPTRLRLIATAKTHDRVLELTELDAVVIVDRGDKLFFPDRRVIYPLRDEKTYSLMPKILLHVPLYYFGITLPEPDIQYLNNEKLKLMNLQIEFVQNFGQESLYRLSER